MTTKYCLNNKKQPQAHFFKRTSSLLKLLNLLTVAGMEMKLGTHVHYIIFITTTGIFLYHRNIVVYKISGDKQFKDPANLKKYEYRDCKGDGIHKA